MTRYQFKTNLSCSACVSKIARFLDAEKSILKWEVDLNSQDKLLYVEAENLPDDLIPALLRKAGYTATQN